MFDRHHILFSLSIITSGTRVTSVLDVLSKFNHTICNVPGIPNKQSSIYIIADINLLFFSISTLKFQDFKEKLWCELIDSLFVIFLQLVRTMCVTPVAVCMDRGSPPSVCLFSSSSPTFFWSICSLQDSSKSPTNTIISVVSKAYHSIQTKCSLLL